MKLNGWVRLGIVASVLWVLGCGFYWYMEAVDQAVKVGNLYEAACQREKEEGTRPADFNCWDEFSVHSDKHMVKSRPYIVAFTLIPLAFFWLFAGIVVVTWRWVARGFRQ